MIGSFIFLATFLSLDSCHGQGNWTQLHQSVFDNNLLKINYLLKTATWQQLFTLAPLAQANVSLMPVHLAVAFGYKEAFVALMAKNRSQADYGRDSRGDLPIHYAAKLSRMNSLKILVTDIRADINALGYKNRTALHEAAANNKLEAVKFLLKHGADAYRMSSDSDGRMMPIHLAAGRGYLRIVHNFAETIPGIEYEKTGYQIDVISLVDRILRRVRNDRVKATLVKVRRYLESRFELKATTPPTWNCNKTLHIAAFEGNVREIARLVNEENARVDEPSCLAYGKELPLHLASQNGYIKAVKYLLTKKQTMVTARDSTGRLAIHRAAAAGHSDVVLALIQLSQDANERGYRGSTPLIVAAGEGHLNVVKALLEDSPWSKGEPSLRQSPQGYSMTALLVAAYNGHLPVVEYLVNNDETLLQDLDSRGNTVLQLALENDHFDIINYLLMNTTVDIQTPNELGRTILHQASAKGRLELVKNLVAKGANILQKSSRSDGGQLPVHVAAYSGHKDVVKYFVENNPELLSVTNSLNETPLDIAKRYGEYGVDTSDVVNYLEELVIGGSSN